MPATYVIDNARARFPAGTAVDAYPLSGWAQHQLPPSGAPVGASTEQKTVAADGTLEFVALLPNTRYVAYAEVGGEHRYVRFTTPRYGRAELETAGTAADQTVVPAVPGRSIALSGHVLSAGGAVTARWKSGANEMGGPLKFSDTGGLSHPTVGEPIRTRRGEALVIETEQAVVVGGHVIYTLEPVV